MFIKDSTKERNALAPYHDQPVMVRGFIQRAHMPNPNERLFCFINPEVAPLFDEEAFDSRQGVKLSHLWVKINKFEHAKVWNAYKACIYTTINFPARVSYYQRNDGTSAYGIRIDNELCFPCADELIVKSNSAIYRILDGDLSNNRQLLLCRDILISALAQLNDVQQVICYFKSLKRFKLSAKKLIKTIDAKIKITNNRAGRRRERRSQLKRSSKRPTAAGFA